ncbi:hypothetical protein ACFYWN_46755, partial [Streptomyces sp. NPDC002917]|uniref:hypothetical protein n=1 Tax=Streptomyces sp. NPDC002917 TaxID=3364671 RepID=UPI0036973286
MSDQPIDGAGTNDAPASPAGVEERAAYLSAGEALLSDNGRITSTPQAKTVAIEALAQRMRASTVPNQCPGVSLVPMSQYCAHPERFWMRWSPAFSLSLSGDAHRVHA